MACIGDTETELGRFGRGGRVALGVAAEQNGAGGVMDQVVPGGVEADIAKGWAAIAPDDDQV